MLIETKCYSLQDESDFYFLKLKGVLDNNNHDGFSDSMESVMEKKKKNLIISCEHVEHMSMKWVRSLLQICTDLRPDNLKVFLILLPPEVRHWILQLGIDSAFMIFPSMREAQHFLGIKPKRKLDTEFINPFLDATIKVLGVQAGLNFTPGKMSVTKADNPHMGDVSGIIGIISTAFNGSVVISFPEQTFLKVMSGLLSEDITTMSKDILDGAGEITNMIFGQAKITLNEKGYGIKMALPSVIYGKNHTTHSTARGPTLIIPFHGDAGDFFVEVCLSD